MIIDSHAHIYPEKIAAKAAVTIGKFYNIQMDYDGTVDHLLQVGDAAGVDRFLVHSVATTAAQVSRINDYILGEVAEHPDRFIGFATMHPDMEEPDAEFARCMDAGLHGIKLHPDFQTFAIDDPKMDRIYGLAEGVCPILFHTGDRRYAYSNPGRIRPVLEKFPRLQLICAHFGGYSEWDDVRRAYDGLEVWVDTSSSFFALPAEEAKKLIAFFGEDHVLFGSDYPMWNAADEIRNIRSLGLPAETEEKIFSGNLLRLLKL
ncbi:MAG: amidohydrolase [Clostridia bacterium]|nr:amidohydrolase [Clostridia bacterium]